MKRTPPTLKLLPSSLLASLPVRNTTGIRLVFSDLFSKKSLRNVKFHSVEYDRKIPAKVKKKDLMKVLAGFVTVKDSQDCFIVKYDVHYEKSKMITS